MAGSTLEDELAEKDSRSPNEGAESVGPDLAGLRLTVDELARVVGLAPRTIRAHQARKLLAPPVRQGRTAYYHAGHVRRLEAIKALQREGFNLYSIESMLGVRTADAGGEAPAARLRRVLDKHLSPADPPEAVVRALVEALDRVRPMARDLVAAVTALAPAHAVPDDRVALLQSLSAVFADAIRSAVDEAAVADATDESPVADATEESPDQGRFSAGSGSGQPG